MRDWWWLAVVALVCPLSFGCGTGSSGADDTAGPHDLRAWDDARGGDVLADPGPDNRGKDSTQPLDQVEADAALDSADASAEMQTEVGPQEVSDAGADQSAEVVDDVASDLKEEVHADVAQDQTVPDVCMAQCDGKVCGDDGCGGSCGECMSWCDPTCDLPEVPYVAPFLCSDDGTLCYQECCPNCCGRECGPDGCGGLCGQCAGAQDVCEQGECVCQGDCSGRECGSDGCGGGCGTCNDNNLCTNDSCDVATGLCLFVDNQAGCDDSNPCTVGDFCSEGECHGGSLLQCDDGNPCTDNVCGADGVCLYPDNSAPCDDSDACTVDDVCGEGICKGSPYPCPTEGCLFTKCVEIFGAPDCLCL